MHKTEICFVLVWIVPGKLSLQLWSNPNLHAPTPALPRPCAVLSSSTREDSQHGEAYGLAPYATSNAPRCVPPAMVLAWAAAGQTRKVFLSLEAQVTSDDPYTTVRVY